MSDHAERVLDMYERDEETGAQLRDEMAPAPRHLTALARAQRDRRIIALIAGGADPAKVAEVLNLKVKIVYAAIKRGIKVVEDTPVRDLEIVRELSLQRLDTMLLSIWVKVQAGDLRAIDRALKIEEQRAKLGGLYQEDKQPDQHLHLHGVTPAEIESATDAWRKRTDPGDDPPGPPEPDEPSALEQFAALPDVDIGDADVVELPE